MLLQVRIAYWRGSTGEGWRLVRRTNQWYRRSLMRGHRSVIVSQDRRRRNISPWERIEAAPNLVDRNRLDQDI